MTLKSEYFKYMFDIISNRVKQTIRFKQFGIGYSFAELVNMMSSEKNILFDFSGINNTNVASEGLAFFLITQIISGRKIGVSAGGLDSKFEDFPWDFLNVLSRDAHWLNYRYDWVFNLGSDLVSYFDSECCASAMSLYDDMVFLDVIASNDARCGFDKVSNFIHTHPEYKQKHRVVLLTCDKDYSDKVVCDYPDDFIVVRYDNYKKVVDMWFSNHTSIVDPEFEMKMMDSSFDKTKLFQYIGTNYPKKMREYFRYDRKFVREYMTSDDLRLVGCLNSKKKGC